MFRFALVGVGHIGRRYVNILAGNPRYQLVAVCDPCVPPGLALPAGVLVFPGIQDLIAQGVRVDVVVLCTPSGFHYQHARELLDKGYNVLCEKPLALRSADARDLLQASARAGRSVFCVTQNRFSPCAMWLKRLVSGGAIGDIFLVQVCCFWNRDERYYTPGCWRGSNLLDGGTLFTQFSHYIDTLLWIFGDFTCAGGTFANFNHRDAIQFEDSGLLTFEFNTGSLCSFNYSTSVFSENFESSITVIGENGTVKISGPYMDKLEYCRVRDYLLDEAGQAAISAVGGKEQNHEAMLGHVVAEIARGAGETNLPQAIRVVEIIEEIYLLRDKRTIARK